MLELYNLGIQEQELKFIIEQCPNILKISTYEVLEKIEILKLIECSESVIRNIIISNPHYLNRINNDIINLIKKLTTLGIDCLNLFFDSNPFFLNKDVFEIDNYINTRIKMGLTIEDIINELEENPYIIDEI